MATVGPWTFDGGLPKGMCAHPKVDPETGDLVVFRYDFAEPYLTWAVVGRDGAMVHAETPIPIDGTYMIHDCAITADNLVLFVCPFRFDIAAAMRGEPVLSWQPDLGTRIAVVPRDGRPITWFHTDPFWVWHFANAFEDGPDGSSIIVDFCRWDAPGLGGSSVAPTGAVQRATLDIGRGTVDITTTDDGVAEFPRLDDRLLGRRHRHFHTASRDRDHTPTVPGAWNALERFDVETGTKVVRHGGAVCFGEAVSRREPAAPARTTATS